MFISSSFLIIFLKEISKFFKDPFAFYIVANTRHLQYNQQTTNLVILFNEKFPGSLPPSPADSGVSDVDSSSSGGQPCSEELKARLGLTSHCPQQNNHVPPGTFLNPNFYHNSPPLRNLWNNRNVQCKYDI